MLRNMLIMLSILQLCNNHGFWSHPCCTKHAGGMLQLYTVQTLSMLQEGILATPTSACHHSRKLIALTSAQSNTPSKLWKSGKLSLEILP